MMTRYFLGVDVGSWSTKAVIIDGEGNVVGKHILRSGADLAKASEEACKGALENAGLTKDEIERTVSTGYGRKNVPSADLSRTEITCHGLGAYNSYPEAITIVDIGGQDNKIIRMNKEGKNTQFSLNRKCAAGTGAFLEEMALRLDVKLEDLNTLASGHSKKLKLGSFCTVFSGTEILRLIQDGERVEDIAWSLYLSVAMRISEMAPLEGKVVLTGGVIANNPILKDIFENEFNVKCTIPPDPAFIGALGAAIIAKNP